MPQTTPERAARWPGGDTQALDVLGKAGFRWHRGELYHPQGREPTEREWDAVLYMVEEWDFGWRPGPGTERDPA